MAFRRWANRSTPRRLCVVPTCPCYASEKDDHCQGHRAALTRAAQEAAGIYTVAYRVALIAALRQPSLFEETP